MSMWYLGALVPLFPIGAALAIRWMEKWDNRNGKIRRMISTRNESHARRQRYSSAGCDMTQI